MSATSRYSNTKRLLESSGNSYILNLELASSRVRNVIVNCLHILIDINELIYC